MPTPAALRWEPIVRRARESGLSIRAYAREHGLNANTLAWWNWKLADPREDATFIEVTLADPAPPLRLQLGAAHVVVDHSTDLALLRRVVEALS